MHQHLSDLTSHCLWADAILWSAIEATPAALEDEALFKRQHHIHLVQHAFLALMKKERAQIRRPEDFASTLELKAWWEQVRDGLRELLTSMPDERLQERTPIPWLRDPASTFTVEQMLMQVTMHSHYHRGQNAARIRELGGEPPLMDLIVWYWKNGVRLAT